MTNAINGIRTAYTFKKPVNDSIADQSRQHNNDETFFFTNITKVIHKIIFLIKMSFYKIEWR